MRCFRSKGVAARRGLPPLLAFDPVGVSLAEGLRAGLAVAGVILLHEWLRWPGLLEAALGALLTCLCDSGGSLRRRLSSVVAFAAAGALTTCSFAALRDGPVALTVLAGGLVIFFAAFARAFGVAAMQVGNLLAVVLTLALREGGPGPAAAVTAGGAFLAGSLWAVLLTAAIWKVQPYRPARTAVGACLRALSVMVTDMQGLVDVSADERAWDLHARLQRRRVRDRIEAARAAVLATVRARGPAEGPAAQSWLRLEAADQLFEALIALSDLLAGEARPYDARPDRMLRMVAAVLRVLEREVQREDSRLTAGLETAIAAIPALVGPRASPLHRLAEVIAERLRSTLSPSRGPDRLPVIPGRPWREVVRANVAPGSVVLRHALRAALVALPGLALLLLWPQPYLHWFTITLLVTLQPNVAPTAVRAAERVGGTVLGGLGATALSAVCTTPLQIAAALFPLAVLALTVRAVSFGLFMAALTPVVVLLTELGQPGVSEFRIAVLRALFTLAGGVSAFLAGVLLWPTWEPRRLPQELRAALAAHGRYAAGVIAEKLGERLDASSEVARREAGAASNAFEASLQRLLLERRLRSDAALDALLTVDAALRRLAGRLSALHLSHNEAARDEADWRAMRDWILVVTERLGQDRVDIPPRPALAAGSRDGPLTRLARPLELAAGALARARSAGQT